MRPHNKLVYISHPYTTPPGIIANATAIKEICKKVSEFDGIVPLAPTYAQSWLDDPYDEQENLLALSYCIEMLKRCDEVWFFGAWRGSMGCQAEYEAAVTYEIPRKEFVFDNVDDEP